ncbi:hypothetical protein [Neobacillus mesonae]|nr:hypothetical protein [Neobacillus mesonae]
MARASLDLLTAEIVARVRGVLERNSELAGTSRAELDAQMKAMRKAQLMDLFIDSFEGNISSSEICDFVKAIFDFDLDVMPILSKELVEQTLAPESNEPLIRQIIDTYLNRRDQRPDGPGIRQMINQVLGINLDAISSLEGARISLFSKGQWVVYHAHDLFIVDTGAGDIDVSVYPTKYFTEQTGLEELPSDLQQALSKIGYRRGGKPGSYYFITPTGEPVPDSFKGQTMGAILKVIHDSYLQL